MKKIVLLFFAWSFSGIVCSVIYSCDDCDNDGPLNFQLTSISGEVRKITGTEDGAPFGDYITEPYLQDEESIRYDSVGVNISHEFELIAFLTGQFISSSIACDPIHRFETLQNITISSSHDYTPEYPSGSDLGNIVSLRPYYELQGQPVTSFLSYHELGYENIFLTFDEAPAEDAIHNLTITYILDNSRQITTTIEGLYIRN